MAYIDNPFKSGDTVICINDRFSMVVTTADKSLIGTLPPIHPAIGESLVIDEILGEFIRFDRYDCKDTSLPDYGWRWWKHTHFKKPDAISIKSEILESIDIPA